MVAAIQKLNRISDVMPAGTKHLKRGIFIPFKFFFVIAKCSQSYRGGTEYVLPGSKRPKNTALNSVKWTMTAY